MPGTYRLFSWEHSYFSAKARAYLRYKQRMGALEPGWEDVLCSADLIQGLLIPKSGSGAVPQLEAPDGTWIQDSSAIIDFVEAAHPAVPVVPDLRGRPRQALACYLVELLADEWLLVPAFWQRWFFSEPGREPSHLPWNLQQWGPALQADAPTASARRAAAAGFFEAGFGISDTRGNPRGVYAGLVHLGCDARTERAWQASQHRILERLEAHFDAHDYVLGGAPSLADFSLLAPLYPHLYRDAVAGFALKTYFPATTEWVERTNGQNALNARTYDQKLYSLGADGALVARPANGHDAAWLPDDAIPETLDALVAVFFDEMWPVLDDAMRTLTAYLDSDAHAPGGELPGKSFTATPGFEALQTGDGALTQAFAIGGIESRRMVVPYQVWLLQRLAEALDALDPPGRAAIDAWVSRFPRGEDLLGLHARLSGCRIEKRGARLYAER